MLFQLVKQWPATISCNQQRAVYALHYQLQLLTRSRWSSCVLFGFLTLGSVNFKSTYPLGHWSFFSNVANTPQWAQLIRSNYDVGVLEECKTKNNQQQITNNIIQRNESYDKFISKFSSSWRSFSERRQQFLHTSCRIFQCSVKTTSYSLQVQGLRSLVNNWENDLYSFDFFQPRFLEF